MELIYLQKLKDTPKKNFTGTIDYNKPISISEINQLESNYNSGNPFPKALKELLFIAGDYCPYLDKGLTDTQQEFQDSIIEDLGYENVNITRPFYAIDDFMGIGEYFMFIYLDEGKPNPPVHMAQIISEGILEVTDFSPSLSEYLNLLIDDAKVTGY